MVSAAVSPSMVAMSMPRASMTTARMWSPSSQRSRRASSSEGVTELRGLLVGIGLVGHRAAPDLGAGEVLEQPGRAQGRVELDVERVVRMITNRGLVHREYVGH